jgi:hypothetical protein
VGNSIPNTRRSNAENEALLDSKKPVDQLLADIHEESLNTYDGAPGLFVSRTIARFASLLNILSGQSADTADKNLRTARIVCVLTWLIFVITVLMCVISWIQLSILLKQTAPNSRDGDPHSIQTPNDGRSQNRLDQPK